MEESESLLKSIFAYAQVLAIVILAVFIAWEKVNRWRYGRSGKDRRASNNGCADRTNGSLKRIEKSLKAVHTSISNVHRRIDDGVIETTKIQTTVEGQKEQCKATVARFDETIANQNKALLDIAMEK